MRKFTILGALACFSIITACASDKTESKSIRKEVKMTDVNGQQKLTIKTTENGQTTSETFEGQEAKNKMTELENENSKKDKKIEKRIIEKVEN